jgi:hypothetical protein
VVVLPGVVTGTAAGGGERAAGEAKEGEHGGQEEEHRRFEVRLASILHSMNGEQLKSIGQQVKVRQQGREARATYVKRIAARAASGKVHLEQLRAALGQTKDGKAALAALDVSAVE